MNGSTFFAGRIHTLRATPGEICMLFRFPGRILLYSALVLCPALCAHAQSWVLGPFHRPVSTPAVSPDPHASFVDPVSGKTAAVGVRAHLQPCGGSSRRQGRPALSSRGQYRPAGDRSAHIERLGIAVSADGVHFAAQPKPVFYPADDSQRSREFPGGAEDPRLVQTDDGAYVLTVHSVESQTVTPWASPHQKDLLHWTKVRSGISGRRRRASTGGSSTSLLGILTQLVDGRLVATQPARQVLDVLGRSQDRTCDIARPDPLDAGGGRRRKAARPA